MDRWRLETSRVARPTGAAHVHVAGIAKRHVAGLAQKFAQSGSVVTRSDSLQGAVVERLRRIGIKIHIWILTHHRSDPTVVLGTASSQLGGWGRLGLGPHVVVDATFARGEDLSGGTFAPQLLALLDIPSDSDDELLLSALKSQAARVPDDGLVLASKGNPLWEAMLSEHRGAVEWPGVGRRLVGFRSSRRSGSISVSCVSLKAFRR
jgi:hypothetical protein